MDRAGRMHFIRYCPSRLLPERYARIRDDDAPYYKAASFVVSKDSTHGGTLDLEGIADAIERIAGGEVDIAPAIREVIVVAVQDGDASNIDAEAADCIVQVGLFDEVVYG